MLNYEEAGWQSFTFLKWVSLSKSHMGAAIMRFINRLNIQTSWLKKKKNLCSVSKLTARSLPVGHKKVFWYGKLNIRQLYVHSENSPASRQWWLILVQIPSDPVSILPYQGHYRFGAQTALEILVLGPQFPQGSGDGGTDSEKQSAQQDSELTEWS